MEVRVNDLRLNDQFQCRYHGIDQQEMHQQMMKILLQHKSEYFGKAPVSIDASLLTNESIFLIEKILKLTSNSKWFNIFC